MKDKSPEYPYQDKGIRKDPDRLELVKFLQAAKQEGGTRKMPLGARKFADRFSAALTHYPNVKELPNWIRAMVEKKVSVEELAQTLHDRLHRAPSEENQQMALLLANEIARMKGGSEALQKHITEELLQRLSGKRDLTK